MKFPLFCLFALSLPGLARAQTTAVAPATTEDFASFDHALERQAEKRGASVSGKAESRLKAEVAKESKRAQSNSGSPERRRRGKEKAVDGNSAAIDSRGTRATISGKLSGKEDHSGKGDSGHGTSGGGHGSH